MISIFVKVNYFRADGGAIQSIIGDKLIIFNSEYLRIKNASFDVYAKKRCPNPDSVFSLRATREADAHRFMIFAVLMPLAVVVFTT